MQLKLSILISICFVLFSSTCFAPVDPKCNVWVHDCADDDETKAWFTVITCRQARWDERRRVPVNNRPDEMHVRREFSLPDSKKDFWNSYASTQMVGKTDNWVFQNTWTVSICDDCERLARANNLYGNVGDNSFPEPKYHLADDLVRSGTLEAWLLNDAIAFRAVPVMKDPVLPYKEEKFFDERMPGWMRREQMKW